MVAAQASPFLPLKGTLRGKHRYITRRITATIYLLVYNALKGIITQLQSYLQKASLLLFSNSKADLWTLI